MIFKNQTLKSDFDSEKQNYNKNIQVNEEKIFLIILQFLNFLIVKLSF